MNELPDSQREIVRMRFYENLSFKEIAELTNISINTALGRMRYAIMNMRRMAEENHLALEV
jgi:RNA polymerase sigma-70 factor (ECF subfamily)